jgi:hypothetical protein
MTAYVGNPYVVQAMAVLDRLADAAESAPATT